MKPISSLKEAKTLIGERIQIIKNTGGHSIPLGTIATVFTVGVNGSNVVFYLDEYDGFVTTRDISTIEITLDYLKASLDSLTTKFEIQKKVLNDKIEFMESGGHEIFIEEDFNIYVALKKLKESPDTISKESIIKELLNKNK